MTAVIVNATVALGFGSFTVLCSKVVIPGCQLFTTQQTTLLFYNSTLGQLENASFLPSYVTIPDNSTNATNVTWYAPPLECQMTQMGSVGFHDVGNLVMCILGIFLSFYMARKVHSKPMAVGWKELNTFLISYAVLLLLQAIAGSLVSASSVGIGGVQIAAALNVAGILLALGTLFYFGFVGFQYWPDGSRKSLVLELAVGLGFWAIALGICLSTARGQSPLNTWTSSNLYSPALAVVYLIVPGLLLLFYLGATVVLISSELGIGKPLFILLGGSLLFALGQILQMTISTPLCKASGGAVDGTFFQTFLTLLSVICIFKCWDMITEDEPEPKFVINGGEAFLSEESLAPSEKS